MGVLGIKGISPIVSSVSLSASFFILVTQLMHSEAMGQSIDILGGFTPCWISSLPPSLLLHLLSHFLYVCMAFDPGHL
jgi:hypothetical protein